MMGKAATKVKNWREAKKDCWPLASVGREASGEDVTPFSIEKRTKHNRKRQKWDKTGNGSKTLLEETIWENVTLVCY